MAEHASAGPLTVPRLVAALTELGVQPGATLLVHASLSNFGRIYGGAQAVIEALQQTVTKSGTLVMPTLTLGRFDPSEWANPRVPAEQWDEIRFQTPLFDPDKTPTDHTMSCVYELFRTWPGVVRTRHPHSSLAAWGEHRDVIVREHQLHDRFGETSPLARLYDLEAQVLFLGTGYSTNTCFHLGEYRQRQPPHRMYQIVLEVDGVKTLVTYEDVDTNSSLFATMGADYEADAFAAVTDERKTAEIRAAQIGNAYCRLFNLRNAVDFAQDWLDTR